MSKSDPPHPHRPDLANPPLLPDLVVPFAAVPTAGEAGDLGASSEIALRVQLLGVERLVARIAELVGRRRPAEPVTVSLPFKMLLFVLVNGWGLIITALVASYK